MNIDCNFRGNIYVVQNSKVVIEHVSGLTDLANEIPNTIDTKFASASAGKVFVAVAILQLIEQGKLTFEDTLGKLLDIDLHDIDVDVTVEQLLNHTSGVPDYFDESIMEEYEELWFEFHKSCSQRCLANKVETVLTLKKATMAMAYGSLTIRVAKI